VGHGSWKYSFSARLAYHQRFSRNHDWEAYPSITQKVMNHLKSFGNTLIFLNFKKLKAKKNVIEKMFYF